MTNNNSEEISRGDKQISLTIEFKKTEVSLKKYGPYSAVIIKRGIPIGKPGQPALPWQKLFVSVPWDAVFGKLHIIDTKTVTLAEKINIEPCQPDVPILLDTKVEMVPPDRELYASNIIWPEVFTKVTMVRRTGGFAMAELEICPFRYHLPSGKLELIERLDLSLTYTQTGLKLEKPRSAMALKHEQKFMERVEKMVLNPEDVSLYQDLKKMEQLTDLTTYPQIDGVIITSASLASEFQRLATWRTMMGIQTRVVTVEDITEGTVPDTGEAEFWYTSGYFDGGTRDVQEAIRNFIKWASVNWLTDYILLGGDTEIIPCRQAIHSKVGSVNYGDINQSSIVQLGYSPMASTEEIGTSAANVLDNIATVWECAQSDNDPWIKLEVGLHRPVNHVKLRWGNSYANSYAIQVSHDGTTWTDVYTTSSGSGGYEVIHFNCTSAAYVRLRITSGTNFSLDTMRIYGPHKSYSSESRYSGTAYRINDTVTRIYLSTRNMRPNPINSIDKNLILIRDGSHAGTIIPYDEGSDDMRLGWHFVDDLVELPATVKDVHTEFLEICGPVEYHDNTFVIKDDLYNYIPTDLYFSDISAAEYSSTNHDWDADGNEIYGERYNNELDGVNGIADIYVGRAPVETPKETDIFIDKVIRYEKFQDKEGSLLPMDFAVSVLLGSENWGSSSPGYLDGSAQGKENIRRSFLDFDPSRWIFTRCYEDYGDVPTEDQTMDLKEASKEDILNAIMDGHNVVSLSSHGGVTYLCYLGSNDINDVVSHPSIFFGNACITNKFDAEAFSEFAILNTDGGAVAYVGNSLSGWTSDNHIELEFWERIVDSYRLGEMFNACKLVCLSVSSWASYSWASYSLNLLGDPAMRVWSDRPKQLNVTHQKEICNGVQIIQATVTSGGHPVQGALVCITMEKILFVTKTTKASGVAYLIVPALSEGTMRITVSGKNLVPYLGSITISAHIADCEVGLGKFDQASAGYPVIDYQDGKQTCKAIDVCGIQAHAGYYLIGSGGMDFKYNINKFPYLHLTIKAKRNTDTCLFLMVHDKEPYEHIRRFVVVGKTPRGNSGFYNVMKGFINIHDDEKWHEYTYDFRKLQEDYPNAETIRIVQFYSYRNCGNTSHAFHLSKLILKCPDVNLIESPHPYPQSYDNTWTITAPVAHQIRIHFSKLETEQYFDRVYIYDKNDVEISRYEGYHTNKWTPWVEGDTIKVRLKADGSVQKFGFIVDQKEIRRI